VLGTLAEQRIHEKKSWEAICVLLFCSFEMDTKYSEGECYLYFIENNKVFWHVAEAQVF